jgi:hypothetical protein
MWVLAKRRTVQCDQKFAHHPMVILQHSESGSAAENVIIELVESLNREIVDSKPWVLIMDVYPSHQTECVLVQQRHRALNSFVSRPVELVDSSRWTTKSSAS